MKKLTVLGCGDAFASGGRFTTSFLVEGDDNDFLMDCGVTTLVRLKQNKYDLSKLKSVFITHFHGDHYGGLPFLFIECIFNRKMERAPFKVFGPKGIAKQMRTLQEAMYPDSASRVIDDKVEFVEYAEGSIKENNLTVEAIPVIHSEPANPHGLRLSWNDKTLAFSGDAEWTPAISEIGANADVFITECNHLWEDGPGHISYQNLMDHQSDLSAKKIYLSHMGEQMLAFDASKYEKLKDNQVITLW